MNEQDDDPIDAAVASILPGLQAPKPDFPKPDNLEEKARKWLIANFPLSHGADRAESLAALLRSTVAEAVKEKEEAEARWVEEEANYVSSIELRDVEVRKRAAAEAEANKLREALRRIEAGCRLDAPGSSMLPEIARIAREVLK